MEAGKRIVTDIFNRSRKLEIPFFQRAYVWSEDNWERFLDDMLVTAARQRPYFLGSVIQKQRNTSSGAATGDVRGVVDGQQRLTTLMLFFKTVFEARAEDAVFEGTFRTFKGEWILQHNMADLPVFEAILDGRLTDQLRFEYEGSSQVLAAWDWFQERRDELAAVDPTLLFHLIYFVGIDLGADEDEQQIFDTINSLGVALSTAELLKNELFERGDLSLYERTWRKVFEQESDDREYWGKRITSGRSRRETIDLFLQAHLVLQPGVGDDLRVDRLFDEYKKHLKAVGPAGREAFIDDLAASAALWRRSVQPDLVGQELDPGRAIDRLNVVLFGLNTTTVFPYVLYVLKNVANAAERSRIFGLLETYLIRRLVCRETSKNYNKVFTGFIRAGLDSYDGLAKRLLGATDAGVRMPSDDTFAAGFLRSNLTNAQARLVLYMLEASVRERSFHNTALNGYAHYTLEHLMPKKWRNHWGALPKEEAEERDQALRKMGNLSLLSSRLNTSIRDADWSTKKAGKGNRHGLSHYAAALETLGTDLQLPAWDEAAIGARGRRLAQQALAVWPRPATGA